MNVGLFARGRVQAHISAFFSPGMPVRLITVALETCVPCVVGQ